MEKAMALILVCLGFALVCCTDDPSTVDDDGQGPVSEYAGVFQVESELISNDCVIPVPPDNFVTIVIDGDSIYFDGIAGDWDEGVLTGSGTSPEQTVPVIVGECNAYYTINFHITYTDADSFSGTYGADYRKDVTCPNPDPCSYSYSITGSRQ